MALNSISSDQLMSSISWDIFLFKVEHCCSYLINLQTCCKQLLRTSPGTHGVRVCMLGGGVVFGFVFFFLIHRGTLTQKSKVQTKKKTLVSRIEETFFLLRLLFFSFFKVFDNLGVVWFVFIVKTLRKNNSQSVPFFPAEWCSVCEMEQLRQFQLGSQNHLLFNQELQILRWLFMMEMASHAL